MSTMLYEVASRFKAVSQRNCNLTRGFTRPHCPSADSLPPNVLHFCAAIVCCFYHSIFSHQDHRSRACVKHVELAARVSASMSQSVAVDESVVVRRGARVVRMTQVTCASCA